MANYRLINCEFIRAGSFKTNVSNKAKLLYLLMFMSGDDRGFVDTTQDIITTLEKNDLDFDSNNVSMQLLGNSYQNALDELVNKGYLYEFIDNHYNKVYLIRHWFFHNRLIKGLWTNYKKFLEKVEIVNNEYVYKKPLKENKLNENKLKQNKLKHIKLISQSVDEEEKDEIDTNELLNDFLKSKGVENFSDLTQEEMVEWQEFVINSSGDDDLPM